MNDLTTKSPAEIDTALAEINGRLDYPLGVLASLHKALDRQGRYALREDDRQRYEREVDTYQGQVDALLLQAAPLDEEFIARGGWSRAFLCLATGGHIHATRACSTTRWNTAFGWLPQVSGKDEAEIVAAAGADACTVCYPTAPVESLTRPRTLFHESEVEAQARRVALTARKAELAAKRAKNAITNLDGSRLVVTGDRLDTVTAAKGWLTSQAEMKNLGYPNLHAQEVLDHVAAALAAKLGTTVEVEHSAAAKRAAKRT